MSFNTYGQNKKSVGGLRQVWAEVTGVKSGGGVLSGFEELPVGAVVAAGTPVYLDKAGGKLVAINTFEIADDASAGATDYVINGDVLPQIGSSLKIDGGGDAVEVTGVAENTDGSINITVGATLGALDAGVVLVEDLEAEPNGLLWHDIVKEEGDFMATGAVVDRGRIYEDRINPIPATFKALLPSIKFEKGI